MTWRLLCSAQNKGENQLADVLLSIILILSVKVHAPLFICWGVIEKAGAKEQASDSIGRTVVVFLTSRQGQIQIGPEGIPALSSTSATRRGLLQNPSEAELSVKRLKTVSLVAGTGQSVAF